MFDNCKESMEDVKQLLTDWFSEGKMFDPKEFDPESFVTKLSLYFQGLDKKNPEDVIAGFIKR